MKDLKLITLIPQYFNNLSSSKSQKCEITFFLEYIHIYINKIKEIVSINAHIIKSQFIQMNHDLKGH